MTEDASARAVLDGVVASIGPASEAQAAGAARRLKARSGPRSEWGLLERLAVDLAAARHAPRPRTAARRAVVVAADHGVGDPGVDLGDAAPTRVALHHVAGGGAALNTAARTTGTTLVLVDAGVRGDPGAAGVLSLRAGDGTADITRGPAMSAGQALAAITTGVALCYSLAEDGLDVAALGQLGVGAEPASTAVIAALAGADPASIGGVDAGAAARALSANAPDSARPLEVLAAVGGFDIGVLAGLVLGAASISVPVVLDDHATAAAALVAARLAPDVRGYLVASHLGSIPAQRTALGELDLEPLMSLGVSHGEGTGAVLALPMIDAAASLLAPAG